MPKATKLMSMLIPNRASMVMSGPFGSGSSDPRSLREVRRAGRRARRMAGGAKAKLSDLSAPLDRGLYRKGRYPTCLWQRRPLLRSATEANDGKECLQHALNVCGDSLGRACRQRLGAPGVKAANPPPIARLH